MRSSSTSSGLSGEGRTSKRLYGGQIFDPCNMAEFSNEFVVVTPWIATAVGSSPGTGLEAICRDGAKKGQRFIPRKMNFATNYCL